MTRDRNESGQYVQSATLDDVLTVFEAVEGPAVTSSDVAEQFDVSTEWARQRLADLVDRGDVARRKSGRTTLYWRSGADVAREGGDDA